MRQMLQYVRRNLEQLKELIENFDFLEKIEVEERIKTAQKIYDQQHQMHKEKVNTVKDRIVSWWREYVRPIKRGKGGKKNVEFRPKISASCVDGIFFVDEFNHDNYSEAKKDIVERQIDNYKRRFGKKPPSMTGDQLYGTRENREMLKEKEMRSAFKPLGRKCKESKKL